MNRDVVQADPFNAATPMRALDGREVPADLFYVRSHFDPPADLVPDYRLTISGLVGTPVQLTLDDLAAMPQRELAVTLECAGNGRSVLNPPAPGTPWSFGAAGTARFSGVAVRDVLDRADYNPEAQHLLAIGADSGDVGGHVLPYSRSLPLSRALHRDTLLAVEMNGEPLTAEHGAPLRLIVPGWYAMASVKWIVELGVRASEFQGWFHEERYCYLGDSVAEEGAPVTRVRVRSVIATPAEGDRVVVGRPVVMTGSAWASDDGVAQVLVSCDGGQTWNEAVVDDAVGSYAARGWRWEWTPTSEGPVDLMARATDGSGRSQPLTQRWNRLGYGNNSVHRVSVEVADRSDQ